MLQLWGLYSNLRSWHIYFLNKNTMFVMPTLFLFHSCAIIELAKNRWFSFCNRFELFDQIWAECVQLWGSHLFLMAQTLYFFSDRYTPLGHFGRFAEYSIVWNANFEFSCTALVCLLHGIISSGDVDGRLGGCGGDGGDCITNVWQEEDDCIFEYLIHYFPLLRGLRIKSRKQ